jgi:RNA polymerase sigma-70 factor (ECF subfamily)
LNDDTLPYLSAMDSLALEDLMKKYGQQVWSFAYVLTKNRHLADDVTQDVFLQAYRHVASFRGESSVKTWLLAITRNICRNYRHAAFFRKVLLVGDSTPREDYDQSAEQAFLEREAANGVWRQVFRLPAKLRETLVLHAKYELSTAEIAKLLRIPEGTVKSRLFAARKKLSNLLKEETAYATT